MDRSWLGWAEIEPVDDVYAGSLVSLKLTYHAGKFGIDDGGSIKIARRSVSDSEPLQFDDPLGTGYTTGETAQMNTKETCCSVPPIRLQLSLQAVPSPKETVAQRD